MCSSGLVERESNNSVPDLEHFPFIPLTGYDRGWATNKISAKNFKRLRHQRSEVISDLCRRLESLTPDAVKICASQTDWIANRKNDSNLYTLKRAENLDLYLMMLLDLNAIEALPTLLRLEKAVEPKAAYRLPIEVLRANGPLGTELEHLRLLSIIAALLKNEQAPGHSKLAPSIRYNQTGRDLMIQVANDFAKEADPKKYRGAAAMAPEPISR